MEKDKQEAKPEGIGKQRDAQDVQTYQTGTPLLRTQGNELASDTRPLSLSRALDGDTPKDEAFSIKVVHVPFSACRVAKQD